jgi:hypothetical protein
MTERGYHSFHKEFDELVKKHDLTAYALVLLVDSETDEESHTVVLTKVAPEEETWLFMERVRQLLFGLSRTLIEVAEQFFDLGPEATLGMLHGMITDMSDQKTAEELHSMHAEEDAVLSQLPKSNKKAKSEWH